MRLWICVAAILIGAACSALPSVPTHLQPRGAAIRASGGAFSASYSGSYQVATCELNRGSFAFSGSGSGSFIHNSAETGSMETTFGGGGCNWTGTATLTNALHPRNSINMDLSFGTRTGGSPCQAFLNHVKFVAVGGTGRFVNAYGNGIVKFTCNSNGTYSDQWSGTITF